MLQDARLLYGAVAMSASMFVFSFLHKREELDDDEDESAERLVTTELFYQAMENMPHLTTPQRLEMRRFWRNLVNKNLQKRPSSDMNDALNDDETRNPELRIRDVQVFAQEYKRVFPDIFPEKHVLDAAEQAAALMPSAWRDLVGSTSSMIVSTGKRLNHIAKDTKDEVQLAMQRSVRTVLERALHIVASRLKEKLKDPDMPKYLKMNIDIGIEQFMPDVEMEILRKTRDLFRNESLKSDMENMAHPTTQDECCASSLNSQSDAPSFSIATRRFSVFRAVRGHILHHLFPHNKTIWRSFKDPWWGLYTSVGLLPVVGQLWWIFLFLIKDKTNEHQLCQFIVGFKAAQFITLGLIHMMLGVLLYVKCIVLGSMLACQGNMGPALTEGSACFFALQILLVWAAFFRLPYTARPPEAVRLRLKDIENEDCRVFRDAFGNIVHLDRGGYLLKFCGYETLIFIITMALACLVLWLPLDSWQRQALFYWIRTAYGLFSFPFLIFKIPVLTNVLMHTRPMGYNEQGETVRFIIKQRNE